VITNPRPILLACLAAVAALGVCNSAAAQDGKTQDDKTQEEKAQEEKPQEEKPQVDKGNKNKNEKPYGLVFGTAYGPDDRPLYGVKVKIHPLGKDHPTWDLVSDHHGEFAQRVPRGPGDYLVRGEIEVAPVENGKPQMSKKKRWKGEAKVHIEDQERRDFSLHLTE
jgi:Ni/Co efflux regulator RcnB